MRRVNVSPSVSERHLNIESEAYSDEDSIDETTEVENALNVDNELDDTEDHLSRWTGSGTPVSPSASYTSPPGSYTSFSPTFTSASGGGGFPFFTPGRILSMITERTEITSSRPVSRVNPTDTLRRSTMLGGTSQFAHGRSSTEPGLDRPSQPPPRRTGDLIAFFEEKRADQGSPISHSRAASAPGGPRSPSPFFTTASQSTPNFGSVTGYGYGSTGYGSRPSSPTKRESGSSDSSASSASLPISTLLSTPFRGLTSTSGVDTRTDTRTGTYGTRSPFSNTFTDTLTNTYSNTQTPSNTYTAPSTIAGASMMPLRRPQTSPRSPLTSVRNIVAAWKERTPSVAKPSGKSSAQVSVTSTSPPPGDGDGLFGIRRRAERVGARPRESRSADASQRVEDTPLDMTDLIPYTKGNAKVRPIYNLVFDSV
jgi:hypothetical protein